MQAFQDFYPENVAHCDGCGRLSGHGHQIRTYWEGDESVTRFRPQPYHTAIPGFVYGGLLASLIDCHGTGTAASAMYRAEKRPMDSLPAFRFVTQANWDYLRGVYLLRKAIVHGNGNIRELNKEQDRTDLLSFVESHINLHRDGNVIALGSEFAEEAFSVCRSTIKELDSSLVSHYYRE